MARMQTGTENILTLLALELRGGEGTRQGHPGAVSVE